MSFPAIAYHVKLKSMIVQVLGGTVSLVSDISGDLACTVSSAACDYRHRVNNDGILLTVRRLEHAQQLRGQFRNSTGHPVETVIECLIGHQLWEPLPQVLFSEVVNILDEGVLLLMTDKEINRKNFLVGEQRFRIIAVSLAMVFETLFVHIADIHIDFYQSILFVLGNHNKQKIGVFFTFKLLISRDFYKYFILDFQLFTTNFEAYMTSVKLINHSSSTADWN